MPKPQPPINLSDFLALAAMASAKGQPLTVGTLVPGLRVRPANDTPAGERGPPLLLLGTGVGGWCVAEVDAAGAYCCTAEFHADELLLDLRSLEVRLRLLLVLGLQAKTGLGLAPLGYTFQHDRSGPMEDATLLVLQLLQEEDLDLGAGIILLQTIANLWLGRGKLADLILPMARVTPDAMEA